MAYQNLDLAFLENLDREYTQTLVEYFSPLIPNEYFLCTQNEHGQVIVSRKGYKVNIKIQKEQMIFNPSNDVHINNQLLSLSARIFEYYEKLTQYKIRILGSAIQETT